MGLTGSLLSGNGKSSLSLVGFGRFEVGCADVMVADGEDGDAGVFARIFYPAEERTPLNKVSNDSSTERPVWLSRKEYVDGLAAYKNFSPRKAHFIFDWLVGTKRLGCGWHRPLCGSWQRSSPSSQPKYPVVVFSHGLAGCRHFYSTYCCSLASYGFIVAAIEHRDHSACWTYKLEDGESKSGSFVEKSIKMRKLAPMENEFRIRNQQLHRRVAECVKLLHVLEELNLGQCLPAEQRHIGCKVILGQNFDWMQFKGRLDMSKIAVAGHSFGGATAVATCAFSTDFTSAIVLDGWMKPLEKEMYPRAQQSTLFLNAQRFQWPDNIRSMRRIGNETTEKHFYTLTQATHHSFSDFAFLMPSFVGRKLGLQGDVDPRRCAEAVVEFSVQFLRKSFDGTPTDLSSTLERYNDFIVEGTKLNSDDTSTSSRTNL